MCFKEEDGITTLNGDVALLCDGGIEVTAVGGLGDGRACFRLPAAGAESGTVNTAREFGVRTEVEASYDGVNNEAGDLRSLTEADDGIWMILTGRALTLAVFTSEEVEDELGVSMILLGVLNCTGVGAEAVGCCWSKLELPLCGVAIPADGGVARTVAEVVIDPELGTLLCTTIFGM